eukprot:TRINITY_DN10155_c0_g2_i1.p1 TRINITY_DN10155_c0_g2~~TRINITY_DN10155_c0_g2_i1.p1  ORF type:complete len:767 (+),score=177.99 TRINITY_DN10155_c0_g2_i1:43-2343(+)
MERGCLGALWRRLDSHMRRDGDTATAVRQKIVMFALYAGTAALFVPYAALGVASGAYGYAVVSAVCALTALWVWARREATEAFLRVATAVACLTCAYADLMGAPVHNRTWPAYVIVVDLMLVIEAPRYVTKAIVGFALGWLILVQAEYATRAVGLFDLGEVRAWKPYDERRGMCDCVHPPCRAGGASADPVLTLVPMYFVVILDFLLTRGFAEQVLKEKALMEASVDAAEYLAGRLADFDLDAAAAYLDAHAEALPTELAASFRALLDNLSSYEPYLPAALFPDADTPDSRPDSQGPVHPVLAETVPGLLSPRVTLAFTDIRSSTALWEANPEAMQAALDVHCRAMRAAMAAHRGYEVKTVGDSFMVAFETAQQGVQFGAAVQKVLGAVQWPEGLTRPHLDDGFAVLTVRIAVHCGEAPAQQSTLTGRYDYFGPMVNRAARAEPHAAPGAVTVTAEVLDAVGGKAACEADFVVLPYAEARVGKGLAQPLVLTALVPRGMERIEESVRRVALACDEVRAFVTVPRPPSVSTEGTQSTSSPRHAHSPRQLFTAACSASACVGVVKFDSGDAGSGVEATQRAGRRLQALHAALHATRGKLASVVNCVAWASWGLHGSCPQVANESVRCMLLLRRSLAGQENGPVFHAGLATGSVRTVELAPSAVGRRFVTLFGASVALGDSLCRAAAARKAWVLAAALDGADDGDSHARQIAHLRPVEEWPVEGGGTVRVHDVDLASLAEQVAFEASGSPRSSPTAVQSVASWRSLHTG